MGGFRTDSKNTNMAAKLVPYLDADGKHMTYDSDFYYDPSTNTLTVDKITEAGTPQTLTGAGAVTLTEKTTLLVTTGTDALTLADGTEGKEKFIVMKTDGGDGTLTPTNLANGTTITFDDAGDSAHLLFTDGAWTFMGGTATLA